METSVAKLRGDGQIGPGVAVEVGGGQRRRIVPDRQAERLGKRSVPAAQQQRQVVGLAVGQAQIEPAVAVDSRRRSATPGRCRQRRGLL